MGEACGEKHNTRSHSSVCDKDKGHSGKHHCSHCGREYEGRMCGVSHNTGNHSAPCDYTDNHDAEHHCSHCGDHF